MASCGLRLNWHIEETLRDSPLHSMNWGTPDYWAKVMNGPDRFGLADPSPELRDAMAGKILEERNKACEEIISKKLAG